MQPLRAKRSVRRGRMEEEKNTANRSNSQPPTPNQQPRTMMTMPTKERMMIPPMMPHQTCAPPPPTLEARADAEGKPAGVALLQVAAEAFPAVLALFPVLHLRCDIGKRVHQPPIPPPPPLAPPPLERTKEITTMPRETKRGSRKRRRRLTQKPIPPAILPDQNLIPAAPHALPRHPLRPRSGSRLLPNQIRILQRTHPIPTLLLLLDPLQHHPPHQPIQPPRRRRRRRRRRPRPHTPPRCRRATSTSTPPTTTHTPTPTNTATTTSTRPPQRHVLIDPRRRVGVGATAGWRPGRGAKAREGGDVGFVPRGAGGDGGEAVPAGGVGGGSGRGGGGGGRGGFKVEKGGDAVVSGGGCGGGGGCCGCGCGCCCWGGAGWWRVGWEGVRVRVGGVVGGGVGGLGVSVECGLGGLGKVGGEWMKLGRAWGKLGDSFTLRRTYCMKGLLSGWSGPKLSRSPRVPRTRSPRARTAGRRQA